MTYCEDDLRFEFGRDNSSPTNRDQYCKPPLLFMQWSLGMFHFMPLLLMFVSCLLALSHFVGERRYSKKFGSQSYNANHPIYIIQRKFKSKSASWKASTKLKFDSTTSNSWRGKPHLVLVACFQHATSNTAMDKYQLQPLMLLCML